MGPTGSGKTALAEALADELDAQLINADAFQVYRGMDIGTAKPEARERYELIDIKDPIEDFGVGEFVELAAKLIGRDDRNAVVVGGTGLYVRALFEDYAEMSPAPEPSLREELMRLEATHGLESLYERLEAIRPEIAKTIDRRNPARVRRALEKALDPRPRMKIELPKRRKSKFALSPLRETLHTRIDARLAKMVQNGWIAEVGRLREKGIPRGAPGMRAIGYRAFYDYLAGVKSQEAAEEEIRLETRQYAKRQRTWLRSEPNLSVLDGDLTTEQAFEAAMRIVASQS